MNPETSTACHIKPFSISTTDQKFGVNMMFLKITPKKEKEKNKQ